MRMHDIHIVLLHKSQKTQRVTYPDSGTSGNVMGSHTSGNKTAFQWAEVTPRDYGDIYATHL